MRTLIAYIIAALTILALFIAIPSLGVIVIATGKVSMLGNIAWALVLALPIAHIYHMENQHD